MVSVFGTSGFCIGIVTLFGSIMFSSVFPNLGNVKMTQNSNSKITGNCNNEGNIENNSNMNIHTEDSKVRLEGNSNCRIKLAKAQGTIRDCSNGNVDWKDSSLLNIQSNSNFKIYGGGVSGKCDFLDNSNFQFSGFNILNCLFERNSNMEVRMKDGGFVQAIGNSNLVIEGGLQNLVVADVSNHKISTANDNENRFQIINQDQGWFSSFFGSPAQQLRLRYELDYVGKAVVNRESYEVGDFKWNMIREGNEIKLNFNNNAEGELEFRQINPKTLAISWKGPSGGNSNGQISRQVLRVTGPLPLSVSEGSRTVQVPLVPSSNL